MDKDILLNASHVCKCMQKASNTVIFLDSFKSVVNYCYTKKTQKEALSEDELAHVNEQLDELKLLVTDMVKA